MKSSDLFTRAIANEGKRIKIPLPSGKESDEWLHVHFVDCDAFRQKRAQVLSTAAVAGADKTEKERAELHSLALLSLTASLASGWSLEDEFSQNAMVELLKNAPYLADWLDRKASDAAVFFGNGSTA